MANFGLLLNKVYLSIGSNLGTRDNQLRECLERLENEFGPLLAVSPIYESESWGFQSDDFLNLVCAIDCHRTPVELLEQTQQIENGLGRVKGVDGYESRPIDIDILTFGDEQIEEKGLSIPHTRLAERLFVLMPWRDIASDHKVSGHDLTVKELLAGCEDKGRCKLWGYV